MGPAHARRARRGFRPDVEGLRAVAVTAVVLFHAHVGALGGGYTGVDVFYVVSGFLITGLLWQELERTGRLSLLGFYSRRARRLLPAACLVIVATLLAVREWLPPLQARTVLVDGIASATYWANYRFAASSTNYLDASATPSPFQHFWSLGVEEQFYVVWPVLLVGAYVALRRRRGVRGGLGGPRVGVAVVLAVVAALSFAASVHLTATNQPWAFFSLPTRAWELAVGGLVALTLPFWRRLPDAAGAALSWAGLAAVVGGVIALGSSTPFPGTAALVPVLGTAGVLAGESGRPALGAGVLLGLRPFQVVGRLSYTWYLWHWPLIIVVPIALGSTLTTPEYLGLALGALVLAALTTVVVERPVRTSAWLAARTSRGLGTGAALSGAAVLAAVVAIAALPSLAGHGEAPAASFASGAALRSPPPSSGRSAGEAAGRSVGGAGGRSVEGAAAATAGDAGRPPAPSGGAGPGSERGTGVAGRSATNPLVAALAAATAPIAAAIAASVATTQVPANVAPPLGRAEGDEARPFFDGCFGSFTTSTVPPCDYGDTSGSTTVVLLGDSHATMWFPAVDAVATSRSWRLQSFGKAVCPPNGLTLYSPLLGHSYTECNQFRADALARIAAEHPALVIMSSAWQYVPQLYDVTPFSEAWNQGEAATIRAIEATGAKVLVLGPVPEPTVNVPQCLSGHLGDVQACAASAASPTTHYVGGITVERAAVTAAGATYVDVTPWVCSPTVCPPIVDNLIVFRDNNHLTATYTTYLAPVVAAAMDLALGR